MAAHPVPTRSVSRKPIRISATEASASSLLHSLDGFIVSTLEPFGLCIKKFNRLVAQSGRAPLMFAL